MKVELFMPMETELENEHGARKTRSRLHPYLSDNLPWQIEASTLLPFQKNIANRRVDFLSKDVRKVNIVNYFVWRMQRIPQP